MGNSAGKDGDALRPVIIRRKKMMEEAHHRWHLEGGLRGFCHRTDGVFSGHVAGGSGQ